MREVKKAIAYFRVSTDMQKEDLSLETQEKGGEIFARDNNIEIVKKFTDVMSGGNRNRKGFIEAQKYLEENQGEIDYFIAYDVSRIARDAFAFLSLFNKLNLLNVKLKLINNPTLDSDSPMGKLILTILAAIFEFFRFDNADRVRDNMIVKVKEGKRMNNAPYGYRIIDKKMVIVPEEAELIKYIYQEYLKGHGIVALERMTGKDRSTIKQWLNNKVYAGYNIFGKRKMNKTTFKPMKNPDETKIVEAKGDWEPIIDIDTWEKVANRMSLNQELRMRNIEKTSYLLSGLLFHTCGSKFRGNAGRKGTYYYRCTGCSRSIKSDTLDKKVLDELFNSEFLDELNKIPLENNNKDSELKKLKAQKSKLKTREENLIELYADGDITKEQFKSKKVDIQNSLIDIEAKIIELENERNEVKQNLDFKKMFIEALSNLKNAESKQEANKILKQIIKKIEVNEEREVFIHLNF
ncbi:recombinase family protein [Fusobacterium mortiferum]|uniref:Recombinase family protein n=1 Tax=Fusobacterium mortiferum ATCC 9817 TaxID=469616 RepID=A0ABN5J9Q0_FUSMR|nr:recombinase family protein [Fusobacterium mortiferum]AVQ19237.1 recombinase family protein [Fusobacterium mortiferum ATCC 9817]EEO36360.1 resolvase, N-terminal domain protein [Fusobacterium mortiferum ATCC 9817]